MTRSPRILVAPLNWGLGHATRSIPIIRQLLDRRCDVVLASDGPALDLLKGEFPELLAFELPGINVRYGERFFTLALAAQIPSLVRVIRKEKKAIAQLVASQHIDGVISDNRFGSWGSGVPDAVLSHQWTVETGNPVSRAMATTLHRRILRRYGACWIPDWNGTGSLAGRLSQADDPHTLHVGPLSRLSATNAEKSGAPLQVLVICSGPEPLRTRFEEAVMKQAGALPHRFLIARGLPGAGPVASDLPNVIVRSHLDAKGLSTALSEADVVVSRTGYTTVMDLAATGKKALLIPTPRQPEQEYLGRVHRERGWWAIQDQSGMDLATGLDQAMVLPGAPLHEGQTKSLQVALDAFLGRISPA